MKLPGFVDLQVNGYKGVDFSGSELTEEGFVYAANELFEAGLAAFLPTLITTNEEIYERNLPLIYKAIKKHRLENWIPGIHLEGPFISPNEGARGAHRKDLVKKADTTFLDRLLQWSGHYVKLLTISADIDQAPELCKFAVSQNITVSLGHHLANSRDLANCAEAGATALTHLGNGLPKVGDRHENPLWAGLGNDDLVAMIITDGFHLPPEIIKGIIRIKGIGKTIPVSDAAPISGLEPGRYHTLGNDVMLDESGLLYNPETGYMVGSSKNLVQGINHLLSLKLVTIDDIVRMAVHNPLKLINKSGLNEKLPKKLIFDEKANKVFPKSR